MYQFIQLGIIYTLLHISLISSSLAAPNQASNKSNQTVLKRVAYIALDPGHGGRNLGSVNPHDPSTYEKQFTLIIAEHVRTKLLQLGYRVWMSRREDRPFTLQQRISNAAAAGVDLFVSIHINDATMVGPRGHGTFSLDRFIFDESRLRLHDFDQQRDGLLLRQAATPPPVDPLIREILLDLLHQDAHHEAAYLATMVNDALLQVSPFGTRGVKQANFGVLKGTPAPAIVCEVGFINHPKEGLYVTSKEGMKELAHGISNGIDQFVKKRINPSLRSVIEDKLIE